MKLDLMSPVQKTCGTCDACCRVMPVAEIGLRAFHTCPHLREGMGCGVYHSPKKPKSCTLWNCQWLGETEWGPQFRPDRCGVVVDVSPDVVRYQARADGPLIEIVAIQFWVLPGFENAYKTSPDVQSMIDAVLRAGNAVLWRHRNPLGTSDQFARVIRPDENGRWIVSDPTMSKPVDAWGGTDARLARARDMLGAVAR